MPRTLLLTLLSLAAVLPPVFAQPPHQHAQTIVCFGDSLTAGRGSTQGQSYPDFLEQALIERGLHLRVINAGVDGDTTKDGLQRLPAVLALRPDIAIVELGANDGLRGAPSTTISTQLGTIIAALQKAHVRVLLAGIYMPPNYGPEYKQAFDAVYPALARKYNVPLLPFILKDVYGVPGTMSPDGVHPNSVGYQIMARNVMTALLPLLRK